MKALIGIIFCLGQGALLYTFGLRALLWFPLGFVTSLYITSQLVLPIMMGIPMALVRVMKKKMRPMIFAALLIAPTVWFVGLVLFGFLWPSAVEYLNSKPEFGLGGWLGLVAIVLSPLSKGGREDFRIDFEKSYGRYTIEPPSSVQDDESRVHRPEIETPDELLQMRCEVHITRYQLISFLRTTIKEKVQSGATDDDFEPFAIELHSLVQEHISLGEVMDLISDCQRSPGPLDTRETNSRRELLPPELVQLIREVGEEYVTAGVRNLSELTQAIYERVVDYAPSITTEQVRSAFSGYGYGWQDGWRIIRKRLRELEARDPTDQGSIQRLRNASEEVGDDVLSLSDLLTSVSSDYVGEGRYQDAADTINAAIDLSPDESGLHYSLGGIYELLNDPKAASNAYSEALRLDPRDTEAAKAVERLAGR